MLSTTSLPARWKRFVTAALLLAAAPVARAQTAGQLSSAEAHDSEEGVARGVEAARLRAEGRFEFTHEWWKAGNSGNHDPGGYSNEQWWGLIAVPPDEDGDGLDAWRARAAFQALRALWQSADD